MFFKSGNFLKVGLLTALALLMAGCGAKDVPAGGTDGISGQGSIAEEENSKDMPAVSSEKPAEPTERPTEPTEKPAEPSRESAEDEPRIWEPADFLMNNDIYDESIMDWIEVVTDEDVKEKYFAQTDEQAPRQDFVWLELPPAPGDDFVKVIGADKAYVYMAEYLDNVPEENTVWAVDRLSGEIKRELPVPVEEGNIIKNLNAAAGVIYWVETDGDYSESSPSWSLRRMDCETGEWKEIENSDAYLNAPLLPNVNAYEDTIAYLVAEKLENGEYHQYVKLYHSQSGETEEIFDIRNVVYATEEPYLDEETVAFAEYYEDGWYLNIYYLESGETVREPLAFLVDNEFPFAWSVCGDKLAYHTGLDMLYAKEIGNKEIKVITNGRGGGLGKCALIQEGYYYSGFGSEIWMYNYETGKNELAFSEEGYSASAVKILEGGAVFPDRGKRDG